MPRSRLRRAHHAQTPLVEALDAFTDRTIERAVMDRHVPEQVRPLVEEPLGTRSPPAARVGEQQRRLRAGVLDGVEDLGASVMPRCPAQVNRSTSGSVVTSTRCANAIRPARPGASRAQQHAGRLFQVSQRRRHAPGAGRGRRSGGGRAPARPARRRFVPSSSCPLVNDDAPHAREPLRAARVGQQQREALGVVTRHVGSALPV